jgi:hypothetical protein
LLILVTTVLWAWAAFAQVKVALPMVAGGAVPLYPPLARAANVQGVVHVKVTTDGHRVIATQIEDGHKLLATAAEANARTWEFATHEPTSFTVTYHYKLDAKLQGNPNNPTVVLRLPTEVEVSTVPLVLDSADTSAHDGGHAEVRQQPLGDLNKSECSGGVPDVGHGPFLLPAVFDAGRWRSRGSVGASW